MPVFRRASIPDIDSLLPLIRAFYDVDHHEYREESIRSALTPLLVDDQHGTVLIAEDGRAAIGYAILTWGYSLESGGTDAVLDEIYMTQRNEGIGSQLLDTVIIEAERHGARRVFLETEADNESVRRFYSRHGFERQDSIWMSRDLSN